MQLKDLRLLFDSGAVKKSVVIRFPMGEGYLLMVDKHVLQSQRGGERIFKTIDAAIESSLKIGFKVTTVDLRA